jgi:hypothetical protein
LTTTVNVANPVTSITAVKLNGLAHTWRGDVHVILKAPGGAAHNIIVRPGFTGTGFGDSGDYTSGVFTIVQTGGSALNAGTANLAGGTYNQFFNSGAGQWTAGISNTPLNSITGAAGTWTLEVRDWANADIGSLGGWTLEGTDSGGGGGPISYCGAGDGAVTAPCAIGAGAAGNGCANSGNASGASLTATGSAGADTIVLSQSGELPTSLSIFLQGNSNIAAGVAFGDGVRCVGGNLLRLYSKNAVGGTVAAPGGGDPSIKTQSATLGDVIPPGATRFYQVYYRDPASASGLNFNVGNALEILWP